MHRYVVVILAVFLCGACRPQPPEPRLESTPVDGRAEAGEMVEVRATRPLAHAQESFSLEWNLRGDCAGPLKEADDLKANYRIPADCPGGELVFELTSTTRLGVTEHEYSFRVSPRVHRGPGLHPVRPDPIPDNWEFLNRFEGNVAEEREERRNLRDAYFSEWHHRGGTCRVAGVEDGEHQVLQVSYRLPHSNVSACGYFEYFGGPPGEAEKSDLSGYDRLGFLVRSGTDDLVRFRVELVEFDRFSAYDQGIVSTTDPYVAAGEWRRYEVNLNRLARHWDLASTKNIAFRIDAKDGNPSEGTLLFDDIVLIRATED